MTRLTVLGGGVVLVLAAWLGPDAPQDAVRRVGVRGPATRSGRCSSTRWLSATHSEVKYERI